MLKASISSLCVNFCRPCFPLLSIGKIGKMSEQKRSATPVARGRSTRADRDSSSSSTAWVGALIVIVCIFVGAGCNVTYFTDKMRSIAKHLQLVTPVVDNVHRTLLSEPSHFLSHPLTAESRRLAFAASDTHGELLAAGARQHWRCKRCGEELDAGFCLRRSRAVCAACSQALDVRETEHRPDL